MSSVREQKESEGLVLSQRRCVATQPAESAQSPSRQVGESGLRVHFAYEEWRREQRRESGGLCRCTTNTTEDWFATPSARVSVGSTLYVVR